MIGLRNHWYVAVASVRLKKRPLSSRVLDQDIVLFRDVEGVAHALLDRCSHRGVKLSCGTTTNGTIACGYHGWRFDGAGRCVGIPSLTDKQRIPSKTDVPTFPCEERDGYVWVFIGDTVPGRPPAISDFDERRWRQGSAPQAYTFSKGIENNLDVCHPGFAHPWTHPQWYVHRLLGMREAEMEMRVTPTGLHVFGPPSATAADPPPETIYFSLEFMLPDRVTVKLRGFVIVYHFVPVAEDACRLEWLTSTPLPGPKVWWRKREPKVPAQDRVLLESAQPWYDDGGSFERSVEGDIPTLLSRRIIELDTEGLWEDKRDTLPERRVFSARI